MDPPPPAPLPDHLVEEILLRIPPSDPATLARAAAAQKRWCRLVAGPSIRSRYRALHGAAPMLGFFCDSWDGTGFSNSFVPASSFRPAPTVACCARWTRATAVSFSAPTGAFYVGLMNAFRLIVWDPITRRHQVVLPRPKGFCDDWNWKATMLCAAPAGSCDHLDCHRGHFMVVLIGDDYPTRGMLSCVYTSQNGAWSKIIFARHLDACLGVQSERSSHMGNALYCMSCWGNKILKYDLGTRELSEMEPPVLLSHEGLVSERIQLTTMEDGQLGLAVLRDFTLYIPSTDGEFGWGGGKIIDLKKCGNYDPFIAFICFAGDIGLVFMNAGNNGILSVNISSAQVKVVCRKTCIFCIIVPYINFCTPAMGVPSKDEKPRTSASRDVHSCMVNSLLRQGEIL